MRSRSRLFVAVAATALLGAACGGSDAGPSSTGGAGTSATTAAPTVGAAPTTEVPPTTQPQPEPTDEASEVESVLTFTEYQYITDEIVAVVDLEFPASTKKRVFTGADGWRHPSGNLVFTQGCGQQVARIAVASPTGGVEPITPCSIEIENPGFLDTDFEFARTSPDESRVAVEAKYFLNDQYQYSVLVYEAGELIQVFDGHWAPTWLDDDTVVMGGAGLFVADIGGEPRAIDEGVLASGTNNPDVDSAGERVVFEWNQQLWMIAIDGSGLTELVTGPAHYRFPAWSPDGTAIAFLATSFDDRYDLAIYFRDMESGEFVTLDISDQIGDTAVPRGPLSWTTYLAPG